VQNTGSQVDQNCDQLGLIND